MELVLPVHAPFASDFVDLATIPLRFRLGEPLKPFEQLMSVLLHEVVASASRS